MKKKKVRFIEYVNVPEYDAKTGIWSTVTFESKEDFKDFLRSIFVEDGPETGYQFDDSTLFNPEGIKWLETGSFCNYVDMSKDYITYWDTQKERCRKGVIIHGKNGRTWYLTRDYYMWVNFLPIFHKDKKEILFPDIYDGQYHIALAEKLAELEGKHIALLKKRQYAMSYYHMAKLINQIWFEEGVTLKLLAFAEDHINDKGSWAFLNEYRDFLNEHTAWYRNFEPDKVMAWQQRIKTTVNGRDQYKGLKGRLLGITTKQSPTKGVGGPSAYIMAEESGINSTLDTTYGYAKSALEDGPMSTVGQFIAYGSVGDLKECEPLKKFMFKPKVNGFFSVTTRLMDEKEIPEEAGLFIPETWNMKPFIDKNGNSLVKEAKTALLAKRAVQEAELEPDAYQLEVSQHPLYIAEAFAHRDEAVFPIAILNEQIKRIENNTYSEEWVDLEENEKGEIVIKKSKRTPITDFPIDPKMVNKEGVIQMYERPDKNISWGTYYASIDPVGQGSTTSSVSLCSIIVYKVPTEVISHTDDGKVTSRIEGDKIVCVWAGRFDDVNETHKRLELIIRLYQAYTLIENNVSLFIQYMILHKKHHFLVQKNQVLFLKEQSSDNGHSDFGWRNAGTLFKDNLIPYAKKFISTKMDTKKDSDGEVLRIIYGVERIPDKMILIEAKEYRHRSATQKKINVDRLVTFCALVAFVEIQLSNSGYNKKVEYTKKLENQQNKIKFKLTPFVHLNQKNTKTTRRNPFSHIR